MLIHSTQIQGTQRNPKSWALHDFVIRRSFVIMYEVSRWQEFLHRTTNKSNKGRRSTDGFLGGGQRGGDRKNVITANVSMQLPQDFVCGWSDVRFLLAFNGKFFDQNLDWFCQGNYTYWKRWMRYLLGHQNPWAAWKDMPNWRLSCFITTYLKWKKGLILMKTFATQC